MALTDIQKKKSINFGSLEEFLHRSDKRYEPIRQYGLEQITTGSDANGDPYDNDYFALNLVFNNGES